MIDANQVAPGLWIGSQAMPGPALRKASFDYLVLCAEEWQPPAKAFPGVEVHHAPFDDDPKGLDQAQLQTALVAAEETANRLEAGKKCLVTCMAGRNRSGLVCSLVLAAVSGMPAGHAGQLVRDQRLGALSNMAFRGFLNRVRIERNPQVEACELCEGERVTRRYHEDGICWVADCATCGVPMAVYREHGVAPPERHRKHMFELLRLCARPGQRYKIDEKRRSIPSHYHAHMRPK